MKVQSKTSSNCRLLTGVSLCCLALAASISPAQAQVSPTPSQSDTSSQAAVPASPAHPVENTATSPNTGSDTAAADPQATPAEAATPEANEGGDIVVTGSRLNQGFATPTPVAITSSEELRRAAPANLADGLAQLPQFNGNNRTSVGVPSVAIGTTGQNLLNLRGLGFNRNLVLLDGHRMIATNQVGSVDVNVFPQGIISRVDTVTGGASAAYGSDAISGVVNFVIDRKFEGVRAELQSGVSTRGDVPSVLAQLSVGKSLLDDRLHLVLSGEYFHQNGIDVNDPTDRDWYERAAGRIANPVAGARPSFIVVDDIRSSLGAAGGVITSAGPLRGITFLPGGATGSFDRGTLTGSTFQNGGSGARVNVSLVPNQERYNLFGSARYEITNDINLTVDGLYARSHTLQRAFVEPETGSASQFTIFRDNAYLPASVRQLMVTNNLQSITVGRYETDFPPVELEYTTKLYRGSAGLDGKFGANWSWDLYYSYSQTDQRAREGNNPLSRNLYAAADAVVNNGQVVCRSTLSGLDAGCVPLNIFGVGSPSAAAIDYVLGDSYKDLRLTQHNIAGNIRGKIGNGFLASDESISVASGVEYRDDGASQTSDTLSQTVNSFTGLRGAPAAQNGRQGSFRFFNPQPFSGGIKVVEGYAEVGIPLATDKPFFHQLDLNGAIRQAHYEADGDVYTFASGVSSRTQASSSFNATTWKVGGNWAPIPDVRFRATRSRDIRAPNIIDLYNGSQFSSSNATFNGTTVPIFQLTRGNPNLVPEKADTLTFGAVVQPSFFRGFSFSADYYNIDLKGAISTLLAQQQIDLCAAGDQTYCALQTASNGAVTVITPPFNLNTQKVQGVDLEAQYRTRVGEGTLGLRGYLNITTKDYIQPAVGSIINQRGAADHPRWRTTLQVNYDSPTWGAFVQERIIGKSLIDANLVEGIGISENNIPAIAYTDATFTAKFSQRSEFYLTISNLLDRDPPVSPLPTTTFSIPYNGAYDTIGRAFTIGIRLRTR